MMRLPTRAPRRATLLPYTALFRSAAAAAAPLVGELRMSVIPTIAPFLLPGLLPRLRKERPSLKLFLREEPSAQACESLHHGTVDCVLLALPYEIGRAHV